MGQGLDPRNPSSQRAKLTTSANYPAAAPGWPCNDLAGSLAAEAALCSADSGARLGFVPFVSVM